MAQDTVSEEVQRKALERSQWQFVGPPPRVLFLCRSNSARSQIAEALVNSLSQGQVHAFSAGSQPAAQVHPYAIAAIARLRVDLNQHVPKPLDTFAGQSFDRVVILCEREEQECPVWLGSPPAVHWNYPDPLLVEGTEEEQQRAFDRLAGQLNLRVRLYLTLLERIQKDAQSLQEP